MKLKFKDIVEDSNILNAKDLSVLVGGEEWSGASEEEEEESEENLNGCISYVCINVREIGAQYCDGGAVCTDGIGPCKERT